MAIQMGKMGKSNISDPNMTPMIDVLLVLLVIFMLAQPLLQKSIDVQLPVDEKSDAPPITPIILEIDPQGNYFINTQPVAKDALASRLIEIYSARPDKILFLKADGELVWQEVIHAMDVARGAGVRVLGAVLPT
jgi:biopolymer transport protein ExbD